MNALSTLDTVVLGIYLVLIAGLGSSLYRRRSTARDYFLGGRNFTWIPTGISIVAADLSAITVMGAPAWGFEHNMQLAWLCLGYVLAAPVVIYLFVPFYSRLNLFTAYEYLERRFDVRVRLLTSLLFQILRGMHVAIAIYAPSLVINLVTGLPVAYCVFFMGGVTSIYTTLGGMKAVIWTDVIQFVIVSAGIFLIIWTAVGGAGGLSESIRIAQDGGRLDFLSLSTNPNDLTSIWALLFGGFVLALAPLATDQALLQRLFTTRSEKDCRQAVMLQAALNVPVTLLLYFAGAALYSFHVQNPGRLAGLATPDAVVPYFAVRELPPGISGLLIAAIFAASMAVMSAGINSLTTATTVDFYQRLWRPNGTPEHYARVGRAGTLLWGAAATFAALYADRLGALALAYNRVSSLISGPLLGVFLLGVLSKRVGGAAALIGTFTGMAAAGVVALTTSISFFYHVLVGLAATTGVGWLSASLFESPAEEVISGLVLEKKPGRAPSRWAGVSE